jgi:hypothetical protein
MHPQPKHPHSVLPQDQIVYLRPEAGALVLAGSPALIERAGRPRVPGDLLQRPCIEMRLGDNSSFAWELGNADSMISLAIKGPLVRKRDRRCR